MSEEELYNVLKIKDSMIDELIRKLDNKENIIKEVKEYIEKHTENIDRGQYYEDYVETYPILEILDKENKCTR